VLADIHVDNYSGPVRITVPEMIAEKVLLGDLLYACLQNRVSEGGSTAYQKVFKCHLTQPDFTAIDPPTGGYFFSLMYWSPVSAKSFIISSCIVKEMTIEFDKSGRGDQNLVKIKNLVILGQKITTGITKSGTWVAAGTSYYNAHDFSYKYNDATALEWLRCAVKIDNGAEALDKTTDGYPYTWFLNWGANTVNLEATHWYNANTTGTVVTLLTDYTGGTSRAYSIVSDTADSADGHLKFVIYGKITNFPLATEDRKITAPVVIQGGHNSTSTNDLIIATIGTGATQT
jgi:hypothetical protein